MDKAARETARGPQPFEKYPGLADTIRHLAGNMTGASLARWNDHLAHINIYLRTQEIDNARLQARVSELEAALRPFAAQVFNDNGDISVSKLGVAVEDFVRARKLLLPVAGMRRAVEISGKVYGIADIQRAILTEAAALETPHG